MARGLWDRGLARLVKGSDPQLSATAQVDLDHPATPNEQIALAESWVAHADAATGPLKTVFLAAAEYWYRHAAEQLTGLSKARVGRELAKLGSIPESMRRH